MLNKSNVVVKIIDSNIERSLLHPGLLKFRRKLDKLKAIDFNAISLSTNDFYTLYTTLSHNLLQIQDKLIDLIEITFQNEGSPYLACNHRNLFFTSEKP